MSQQPKFKQLADLVKSRRRAARRGPDEYTAAQARLILCLRSTRAAIADLVELSGEGYRDDVPEEFAPDESYAAVWDHLRAAATASDFVVGTLLAELETYNTAAVRALTAALAAEEPTTTTQHYALIALKRQR